jgi:hypothetical protein
MTIAELRAVVLKIFGPRSRQAGSMYFSQRSPGSLKCISESMILKPFFIKSADDALHSQRLSAAALGVEIRKRLNLDRYSTFTIALLPVYLGGGRTFKRNDFKDRNCFLQWQGALTSEYNDARFMV